MNKEDLIELLKSYKQTLAKRDLKQNEINQMKRIIEKIGVDYSTSITAVYQEGSKSDQINSKVENAVEKKNTKIIELEEKIRQLEEEIRDLNYELNKIDIRLGSLTKLEKEIITAYYVDEQDYNYIGNFTYYEIKHQTRSEDSIKRIIAQTLEKLTKL